MHIRLRASLVGIFAAALIFPFGNAAAQDKSDSDQDDSEETTRVERRRAGRAGNARGSAARQGETQPSNRDRARSGRVRTESRTERRQQEAARVGRRETDRGARQEADRGARQDADRNVRGETDRNRRQNAERDRRQNADRDRRQNNRTQQANRRDDRARVHPRPQIRIDVGWPWIHRHQRQWSPRYRFRQLVHVNAGWSGNRRDSRIDVRTYYRHRVRQASSRRAEVDVYIDRIELYDNGFFIGEVHHIPQELARVRATIYRGGGIGFDRELFLVGDPYAGFEMVSTRHYDGFILNRYRRSHGLRVGVLDLRNERVRQVRRSRFFDTSSFSGFVPISLLPQNGDWLGDYGHNAPSRQWYGDDDRYYYGFSDLDDYARLGGARSQYNRTQPGSTAGEHSTVYSNRALPESAPIQDNAEESYTTEDGATIHFKRESTLERLD